MKKKLFFTVMILLTLSIQSCSKEELSGSSETNMVFEDVPTAKAIEIEILEQINQYRIRNGLSALNNLNIIKAVAYGHTTYMVNKNEVNHDNFFQRKTRLEEEADAIIVSENVAYGYNSAESVVNAWILSEPHKQTIEGDFTDFEISAEQNDDGQWFFTNIFIKR